VGHIFLFDDYNVINKVSEIVLFFSSVVLFIKGFSNREESNSLFLFVLEDGEAAFVYS
jgi:hypothetical protein